MAEIAAAAKTLPGCDNLASIKGIAENGVTILLNTIVDIENFAKSDYLAALFGVMPGVSESNDSLCVGRFTKRGSKIARTTLVQCALFAKRYSPYRHDFYEHIQSRFEADKAIVAFAGKILNMVIYMLKNDWVFENFSNFVIKSCINHGRRRLGAGI